MSQVETLTDVFPEFDIRTNEQRAISSYHADLRYCIDFGGAIRPKMHWIVIWVSYSVILFLKQL